MKILVIDIGGTNIKVKLSDQPEIHKFPSGGEMSAEQMVQGVKELTKNLEYDGVTIGYPGPIIDGKIALEPVNLGPGWVGYDFRSAFGKPVKLINDAAMQALGSYEGGRMLFLGLGTGLGSALIIERVIAPLEIGHLPYKKKRSFEDFVGVRGLEREGKKSWQKSVEDVVTRLKNALIADYVVLGGGNAKKLSQLPPGCRLGHNENAFIGGLRLWTDYPDQQK